MSPCLDDLVLDPARAGLLSSEERQALLAQVVTLLFALGAPAGGDRLLTVTEAADKLGCAPHTLYRNKRHPARVQNGRSVRFSERAIETFIRQHRGRAA
jgi:predicted DNA-binding transcriptional regulator AlpA